MSTYTYTYINYKNILQDVALCLLEAGAIVDQRNQQKQTPLFSACEGLQRNLAHVRTSVISKPSGPVWFMAKLFCVVSIVFIIVNSRITNVVMSCIHLRLFLFKNSHKILLLLTSISCRRSLNINGIKDKI